MKTMTADELRASLAQFYGTQDYHAHFLGVLLTDGAKFLADAAGAHWLMDIIASYQPQCQRDEMLQRIQFWTLKVNDSEGVVTCERDTDDVAIKQDIPHCDFPLDEIKLYVCPAYLQDGPRPLIMLSSEY
jgi:hypothetical protein